MTDTMNPPGFPRPAVFTQTHGLASVALDGMTLLDYMAAKAMQGIVASDTEVALLMNHADRAEFSYHQANAMILERQKWIK